MKVDQPVTGQAQYMEVTSDDPSINQPSSLTFRVQVQNPLRTDSSIEFTIPADFGVAGVDTV